MKPTGARKNLRDKILFERRNNILKEREKLEKLVKELFQKGDRNMGKDTRILKQSSKLDKLIVNEMMLSEMERKIKK